MNLELNVCFRPKADVRNTEIGGSSPIITINEIFLVSIYFCVYNQSLSLAIAQHQGKLHVANRLISS